MITTYEYNNKVYSVNSDATLEELTYQKELFELPLVEWKKLLIKKDGFCNPHRLFVILQAAINYYDNSTAVNGFIYDGKEYWLDKNTRVGLMNLANCSDENIDLVLDDLVLALSPEIIKDLLKKIEVYAGKCYAVTAKHLIEIKKLKSEKELLNYDYTLGYPDKLILK